MQIGGAVSPIMGRETSQVVYEEEEDDWLRKRSKTWHDVTPELFPISAPKYDFEYPVPKIGDEYGGFNLVFDADKNPCFRWPQQHGIQASKGSYVPVHKLLFPHPRRRNFLINNSGHRFDAAHLDGKILVILILSLCPEEQEKTKHFIGVLREAYMELRSRPDIGFEVVFVALEEGVGLEEQFDALFKIMPWLAIPYSDKHARQICEESLHDPVRYGPVSCFILQTNGLIAHHSPAIFTIYGAKAFPFTAQRLEELEKQNLSYFTNPPSMKELLGDSVVSPQGDQVLSAHLDNKVVGLFFPVDRIINTQLVSAWEALKSRGDFEIVCVPEPYSVSSNPYQKGSFPFSTLSDTSLRQKLWWIYHPPLREGFCSYADKHPGVLVIIGPQHNRFFNYYGANILYKFGAEGYPFTLERAAELEQEKLEKLTLGSLLGGEELVCAADRKKVSVAELLGKEVIVLVSWSSWHKERDDMLKKLYKTPLRCISPEGCKIHKGLMEGDDELSIVYISEDGVTDEDYSLKDRVMLCPSKSAHRSCISSGIGLYQPDVAVFGRDGRLAFKSCWEDAGGGRSSEILSCICEIRPELLLQLRDTYFCEDLVGWSHLSPDRKVTQVEYI